MKNSLSNLQINKVGVHDNSHHKEEYATTELLSKEIDKLKIDKNELQEYINDIVNLYDVLEKKVNRIKNSVVDWTIPQDDYIHSDNIQFPEIEFPVYNHNELEGYNPQEHIDWSIPQPIVINSKNIPKLDISKYFNEIDHSQLKGYKLVEHIDWTKEQNVKIHHRNIHIETKDEPKPNTLDKDVIQNQIDNLANVCQSFKSQVKSLLKDKEKFENQIGDLISSYNKLKNQLTKEENKDDSTLKKQISILNESCKTFNEQIRNIEKKIIDISKMEYNHNKLKGYNPDEHINWSIPQNFNVHLDNIPKLDISKYIKDIDHNKLKNYNPLEHIDWTIEQPKNIHHRNTFNSNNIIMQDKPFHKEQKGSLSELRKGKKFIHDNKYHKESYVTINYLNNEIKKALSFKGELKSQINKAFKNLKIVDWTLPQKEYKIHNDNINLKQEEFQIDNTEWKSAGKRGLYQVQISHNIDKELMNITCMDLDTGIIIYPQIQIIDKGIFKVYSKDKNASMLIKIIG